MNTPCKRATMLVGLATLLLFSVACPNQNAELQVNQTVASIASANKAMAASVIQLNGLGLVSVPMTNSILNYNRDVATGVISAEKVLQSGKDWKVIAPEVLVLLKGIHLPAEVDKFVHSPATDVGVTALIASISTIQVLVQQGITEAQK